MQGACFELATLPHYDGEGEIVFKYASSGRFAHWVKVKNLKAPAVKREAEEDWGR
jgi:hypothetical protein